jgi:hypothetical protein
MGAAARGWPAAPTAVLLNRSVAALKARRAPRPATAAAASPVVRMASATAKDACATTSAAPRRCAAPTPTARPTSSASAGASAFEPVATRRGSSASESEAPRHPGQPMVGWPGPQRPPSDRHRYRTWHVHCVRCRTTGHPSRIVRPPAICPDPCHLRNCHVDRRDRCPHGRRV